MRAVLILSVMIATSSLIMPASADPIITDAFQLDRPGLVAAWAPDGARSSDETILLFGEIVAQQGEGVNALARARSPDGTLLWARQVGGSGYDTLTAITVDAVGNVFLAGYTTSADFPVTAGSQASYAGDYDAWIAKLDINGNILWTAILGGSDSDTTADVAAVGDGGAIIVGQTRSCDFPASAGAYAAANANGCDSTADGFVARFAANGALLYATYLGGEDYDEARAVAATPDGAAVVAGSAATAFPTTPGAYSAVGNMYVARLDPTGGTLEWATRIGTGDPNAIALDAQERPHVTGDVRDAGLTPTPGAFQTQWGGGKMCSYWEGPEHVYIEEACADAFVVKLAADGEDAEYVTYLGTEWTEGSRAIGVDARGFAYIGGHTNSSVFPHVDAYTHDRGYGSAFFAAFTPNGRELAFSQEFGSSSGEFLRALAISPGGGAWYTGGSYGDDVPHPNLGEGEWALRVGGPTGGVVFSPRTVSEWWVETYIGGIDAGSVIRVEARDDNSDWVTLTKEPWGFHGGTLHVEPENLVQFRATLDDGRVFHSCSYTSPTDERCLNARFTGVSGNGWWIEVTVQGASPITSVDARLGGGDWRPLAKKSWGDWAASYHAPEGTIVQFRAEGENGGISYSGCYRWTSVTSTSCPSPTTPPPPPPPGEDVTFTHGGGNEWWIEVKVDPHPDAVDAMDTGGNWVPLSFKSWGEWAASFHIEPGNDVRFRATTDGETTVSCWFSHPAGAEDCDTSTPPPPPPTSETTFTHGGGNEWWVEVKIDPKPASAQAMDTGGAWMSMEFKSWGEWAGSFHVEPGNQVKFSATYSDGSRVESCWFTHPAGKTPTGDETCGTTTTTPPPPPTNSTFDATFKNVRGNNYWVETDVTATGGTLSGVDARVNGGSWIGLTKQSYGSWAKSFNVPTGANVEFRARAADGSTDISSTYRWPPS